LAHKVISSVIAGATSAGQVNDNASAATWELSADDLEEIDTALRGGSAINR
jgi:aryl-alcohol dehydrogenase-like predicted oxidoreductase